MQNKGFCGRDGVGGSVGRRGPGGRGRGLPPPSRTCSTPTADTSGIWGPCPPPTTPRRPPRPHAHTTATHIKLLGKRSGDGNATAAPPARSPTTWRSYDATRRCRLSFAHASSILAATSGSSRGRAAGAAAVVPSSAGGAGPGTAAVPSAAGAGPGAAAVVPSSAGGAGPGASLLACAGSRAPHLRSTTCASDGEGNSGSGRCEQVHPLQVQHCRGGGGGQGSHDGNVCPHSMTCLPGRGSSSGVRMTSDFTQ